MRSSEMSLMSGTIKFQFCSLFVKAFRELCFTKTSSKSDLRFQRQRQFCVAENNKIQKEFHTIIGRISKSIFPTYDSFRWIASHMGIALLKSFRSFLIVCEQVSILKKLMFSYIHLFYPHSSTRQYTYLIKLLDSYEPALLKSTRETCC